MKTELTLYIIGKDRMFPSLFQKQSKYLTACIQYCVGGPTQFYKTVKRKDTQFRKHFICSNQCHVLLSATPWTAAHQVSLSIANSRSLLKLMSIESVMPSNHRILCHPLLPPSIFPASGSFQMSQFFPSGGQSIGVSASALVLINIRD